MPNLARMRLAHRPGNAPRMRQPDAARMEYYRALRQLVALARGLVRERLVARLPDLVERQRGDEAREDAQTPGKRVNSIVEQIRQAFARRVPTDKLETLAKRMARETSEVHKSELFRQVKATVGIDLKGIADRRLGLKIREFSAENVALIKSIPATLFSQVETTVIGGIHDGKRAGELADDIEERFGVAESRAKLIARDQIGKFFGDLAKERQTDLGLTRYTWRTMEDERVRPEHALLDGEVFAWDDPPEVGHPGEDYECRCYAEPVFEDVVDGGDE